MVVQNNEKDFRKMGFGVALYAYIVEKRGGGVEEGTVGGDQHAWAHLNLHKLSRNDSDKCYTLFYNMFNA